MIAPSLAEAIPAPPPAPSWPSPHAVLPALLRRLITFGFSLIDSTARAHRESRHPEPPTPGFKPRLDRIERALNWAIALVQVLTGVRSFTYRVRPKSTQAAATAPDLSRPERAHAECFNFGVTADRAMRQAFATQPIGQIVTTICQDLGITRHSELWPAELIELTQTPHDWVQAHHQAPRRPTRSRPARLKPRTSANTNTRASTSTAPPPSSHRRLLLASAAPIALGPLPAGRPPRWRP